MSNKIGRVNFCLPVRNALIAAGYSTVKVLNVCNSQLGDSAKMVKRGDDEMGKVSIQTGKKTATFTVKNGNESYKAQLTDGARFIAWNDDVAKSFKTWNFNSIALPQAAISWLESLKDVKRTDKETESVENVPA